MIAPAFDTAHNAPSGYGGRLRSPNVDHLAGMLASYQHNICTAMRWVHSSWLASALGLGESATQTLRAQFQNDPCGSISLALIRALPFDPPSLERLLGAPAARLDALPIEQGLAALRVRALLLRRAQVRRLIDRNTRVRLTQWTGLSLDRLAGSSATDSPAAPDLTRMLSATAVPSLESLDPTQLALEGYALLAREPWAGKAPCALLRFALPRDAQHPSWLDAVPPMLDETGTGILDAWLADISPECPWLSG